VLLVITRGEPGGAQVHVLELLKGLADRVDFHLAIGDNEFLALEARALGVPVTVVPGLQREVSSGSDIRAFRALRALVRRLRPALVHTHSTKAGLLGRLAAWSLGVPRVHTAHAWSFSDGIPWSRKGWAIPVEAAVGRVTTQFIVVSEADRAIGLRYRVARPAQVRVVHNGVADCPPILPVSHPGPPVLTMVARMATPKDHALLLRALVGINQDFRLRLVGDGPDRTAIERLVGELGLGERVEFLGVRNDVDALFRASDIALLVSRQEGFPLVVLEAMRAGLPVIASDVGGIREAVLHGNTGLLVPRGDEGRLRQDVARLLANCAERKRMGLAGRALYESRFTAVQMCAATVSVYLEVAKNFQPNLSGSRPGADEQRDNVSTTT
jgi:glycosyltransferase involved in cell wall biosynthesis